jgi:hypothetical protein
MENKSSGSLHLVAGTISDVSEALFPLNIWFLLFDLLFYPEEGRGTCPPKRSVFLWTVRRYIPGNSALSSAAGTSNPASNLIVREVSSCV